ncbi:MAG: aminopeptidase [Candidatus Woesearchaeota archaeon]|nr:aminopeptidase [Candidatus Woesearchaeota archaeon]
MSKMDYKNASLKLLKENLALKRGEKLTVVTDRQNCPIFSAVSFAGKKLGAQVKHIHISNNRTNSEPVPELRALFLNSDVIVGITDNSLSHCPETKEAMKKGARIITMPGIGKSNSLFLKAIKADSGKIHAITKKLADKMKGVRKIRVTSPKGTELMIIATPSTIDLDNGDSTSPGSLNNLPYGEVSEAPVNIANGILAIDSSDLGISPSDNVRVELRNGKIISCNNNNARRFVSLLKKIDGERATRIVEIGLGTNYLHTKLMGNILHDEKMIGTVHIAFGGYGDKRKCKIHEDVMVLKPTVWFDGKAVIKDGKIL